MKIYVLLGHPDTESFNSSIAEAYVKRAKELGHDVRYQQLGNMDFDPILHRGFKEIQELEPHLVQAQENLLWCEHWVIVYPMWWGAMPAILKGFIDRTLVPGFAFKYHDNDPMWDKLLAGRSGELIATTDAPKLWTWFMYRNSDFGALKNATMEFCGIKPVKVHRIPNIKNKSREQLSKSIVKIVSGIPKTN